LAEPTRVGLVTRLLGSRKGTEIRSAFPSRLQKCCVPSFPGHRGWNPLVHYVDRKADARKREFSADTALRCCPASVADAWFQLRPGADLPQVSAQSRSLVTGNLDSAASTLDELETVPCAEKKLSSCCDILPRLKLVGFHTFSSLCRGACAALWAFRMEAASLLGAGVPPSSTKACHRSPSSGTCTVTEASCPARPASPCGGLGDGRLSGRLCLSACPAVAREKMGTLRFKLALIPP
jgi:hypothetical protein